MTLDPQLEWLTRLISHRTISSDSNLGLIEEVESYLGSMGISSKRITNEDGTKSNLYAVIGPPIEGGVVLSGHTDVVPVTGQDWATDPFTLIEKDGRYYGRGTCDMKGFIAICLAAVPKMLAADLKRPVILAFSYDEEVGCLGAPDMIKDIIDNIPRPAAVIVGEPTMMKVVDGHKGFAIFRTHVTGYMTHSSQTQRGVSAVSIAARLIGKLEEIADRLARACNAKHFEPPYSSLSINVIRGGTQANIMAGECVFDWDLRVVPGDIVTDIFNEFQSYCDTVEAEMQHKHQGCQIVTECMANTPCLAPRLTTNDPHEAVELALALSGENSTSTVAYGTEAGAFSQKDLSAVICGPGSIDHAHQPDEFISRKQLEAGTAFIDKLIDRLTH